MKRRYLIILVLAFVASCATTEHTPLPAFEKYKLETIFDRFTQVTKLNYIGWEPRLDSRRSVMQIFGIIAAGRKSESAVLNLKSINSTWRYLKCNRVDLLADNDPVYVGQSEHDGEVRVGYVVENVSLSPSLPALKKIGSAKSVEVRICSDVVELSSIEVTAVRDLVQAYENHNAQLANP